MILAQILFDSSLSQSKSSCLCLCAHVHAFAEAFCKGTAAGGWLQRVIHGKGALPFSLPWHKGRSLRPAPDVAHQPQARGGPGWKDETQL